MDYEIKKWNAFELIKKIPNWNIQVVITSPPYNIWKIYEKRKPLEEYLEPYKNLAKVSSKNIELMNYWVLN